MRIDLREVEAMAKVRGAGYLKEIEASGTIAGQFIEIPDEIYVVLLAKYQPHRFNGVGDAVKWLMDKLSIPQCASCKERQRRLNELFPL